MNILVFSINPIFPDRITGGASKHLYHVARHLGQAGHQVNILCAQPKQALSGFEWAENVHVDPILPFHMPFPQPYAISGADLGLIVERVSIHLQGSDRFYIHDGEFLVPDVYAHIPTVASFRDNIYPESVLGTYVSKADEVICVSSYSADVVRYTAGRFFPGLLERIHQVNNGIDFEMFKPVDFRPLASQLGVDSQDDIILLHPHRPEPGKGLPETIRVVDHLVHRYGQTRVKALVPEWIKSMVSTDEAGFYQQMTRLMDELGVREHFVFVPWMPQEKMPMLYSMGDVTLCLGNFVEAFGNVAYESLACGTPSIVARVGVHRTMMPDNLIDKVSYGDVDGAAERVMEILDGRINDPAEVLVYLHSTMDFRRQVSTYADIITGCEKRAPLAFSVPDYDVDQPYVLAPWCCIDGERIYHDFHQGYEKDALLIRLLLEHETISQANAVKKGITPERWQRWLENTWLVPVQSN